MPLLQKGELAVIRETHEISFFGGAARAALVRAFPRCLML